MTHLISFNVNQNLIKSFKNIFSPSSVFFKLTHFSQHWKTKKCLAFIKATAHVIVISVTFVPFNFDWLAHFWRWANLIGLLEFNITPSEMLLTACADQILYNLNLTKLCSVCAKQNVAVKTISNACSVLAI